MYQTTSVLHLQGSKRFVSPVRITYQELERWAPDKRDYVVQKVYEDEENTGRRGIGVCIRLF